MADKESNLDQNQLVCVFESSQNSQIAVISALLESAGIDYSYIEAQLPRELGPDLLGGKIMVAEIHKEDAEMIAAEFLGNASRIESNVQEERVEGHDEIDANPHMAYEFFYGGLGMSFVLFALIAYYYLAKYSSHGEPLRSPIFWIASFSLTIGIGNIRAKRWSALITALICILASTGFLAILPISLQVGPGATIFCICMAAFGASGAWVISRSWQYLNQ